MTNHQDTSEGVREEWLDRLEEHVAMLLNTAIAPEGRGEWRDTFMQAHHWLSTYLHERSHGASPEQSWRIAYRDYPTPPIKEEERCATCGWPPRAPEQWVPHDGPCGPECEENLTGCHCAAPASTAIEERKEETR